MIRQQRVDEMTEILGLMGMGLLVVQEIESDLAFSFVFGMSDRQRRTDRTVADLWVERDRMTFGQLLAALRGWWEPDPVLDEFLDGFLQARNMFIHRITRLEGHDLRYKRGRQRLNRKLQAFLNMAFVARELFKSARRATEILAVGWLEAADSSFTPIEVPPEVEEEAAMFVSLLRFKHAQPE